MGVTGHKRVCVYERERETREMSGEMARSGENKDTAYEYLCRLEEAKK